jgi:hypothetical protein
MDFSGKKGHTERKGRAAKRLPLALLNHLLRKQQMNIIKAQGL